jgi:hypothetical protein
VEGAAGHGGSSIKFTSRGGGAGGVEAIRDGPDKIMPLATQVAMETDRQAEQVLNHFLDLDR